MPYYCTECGEEDNFIGLRDVTQYGEEEIFFDSEGDIQDYGDTDVSDSDGGNWHNLRCNTCDVEIVYMTEREIEEAKTGGLARTQAVVQPKIKVNWKQRIEG